MIVPVIAMAILIIGIVNLREITQSAFYAPLGVCQTMYGAQLMVDAIEYPIPYHQQ
jgi:hypothetical protein